jgi:hypothetical protein
VIDNSWTLKFKQYSDFITHFTANESTFFSYVSLMWNCILTAGMICLWCRMNVSNWTARAAVAAYPTVRYVPTTNALDDTTLDHKLNGFLWTVAARHAIAQSPVLSLADASLLDGNFPSVMCDHTITTSPISFPPDCRPCPLSSFEKLYLTKFFFAKPIRYAQFHNTFPFSSRPPFLSEINPDFRNTKIVLISSHFNIKAHDQIVSAFVFTLDTLSEPLPLEILRGKPMNLVPFLQPILIVVDHINTIFAGSVILSFNPDIHDLVPNSYVSVSHLKMPFTVLKSCLNLDLPSETGKHLNFTPQITTLFP